MKTFRNILIIAAFALILVLTGCDEQSALGSYRTVFFSGNGHVSGEVPTFSMTARTGSTITLPANTGNLAKGSHLFDGWNTEADGSGFTFRPGESFLMPAESITLHAHWERIYQVGDTGPAGGIIFHDKGSYSDGWRYLEAAPASTEWIGRIWGSAASDNVVGTLHDLGAGKANTNLIVEQFELVNGGNYAAYLADQLVYQWYDDWYLPSRIELHYMQSKLHAEGLGGFTDAPYWSSTAAESPDDHAYLVPFDTNAMSMASTDNLLRVRAVRSF